MHGNLPRYTFEYLNTREYGLYYRKDTILSQHYKYFDKSHTWNPSKSIADSTHGAIFNLEFSPTGDLLLAACENRSILAFDPRTLKRVHTLNRAHESCVNCIRFLDSRTFVSCSDDHSIALWDARNLKQRNRTLIGHTSWVKSIEYHRSSGRLVSAAFDSTVRLWDINSFTESEICSGELGLNILGLTRMKLIPDGSKMIIATVAGLIFIVHNLDVSHIAKDLKQFDVLSAMSDEPEHSRGFSFPSGRNNIECVTDFPASSNPWCISSLEVHPQGWGALSRYQCKDLNSGEWTVLHNIQESSSTQESLSSYLTHFIEEPIAARGYIKEHCFSPDGRVVCSPFGNGVRLLSFDQKCRELSECDTGTAHEFHELKTLIGHKQAVVTSRFSTVGPLLATGCLGGTINFHMPKF